MFAARRVIGDGITTSSLRAARRIEVSGEEQELYDWIRDHTEASARFISCDDGNLYLYTRRQPSHDKAAEIPYLDFDVNTVGTHNLLVAARDYCPESPFVFTSTNKVYGDHPNHLPLIEKETRFDYADGREGIDEKMSIDQCLHSPFGASKAAADLLCQEFGLYFQMPTGVFRGGCLTGPQQSGVKLHGYLNYIVKCAVEGRPYTIFGYKGKQVRDQIHGPRCCASFPGLFQEPALR